MLTAVVIVVVLAITTYGAFRVIREENPNALPWLSRPYVWLAVANVALAFWVAFLTLAFAMGIGDSGDWSNLPASAEAGMTLAGYLFCPAGLIWLASPSIVLLALAKRLPAWFVAGAFASVVAPLIPLLLQAVIVQRVVGASTVNAHDAMGLSKEIFVLAGGTVLFTSAIVPLVYWSRRVGAQGEPAS